MKEATLQWLQDPSQINGNNLNNVRREANRNFMNKKRKYLKGKIYMLSSHSKNKKITDLYWEKNEFKDGYQHRSYLLKNENGDLLTDSSNISNIW
jgi:hypothetical protein